MDNIFKRMFGRNRNIGQMINRAVTEKMDPLLDNLPLFEESNVHRGDNLAIASKNIWKDRGKHTDALIKYLTERKRKSTIPFRKVTNGNLSMVRTPFNYDRLESFYNKESYFSRSIVRQIETMMRNGLSLVSENNKMAGEVKMELNRLQMDSGISLEQMIWQWGRNIQLSGILLVQKVRRRIKDPISGGMRRESKISKLRIMNPNGIALYFDGYGQLVSAYEPTISRISRKAQQQSSTQKNTPPGILAQDLVVAYAADPGDNVFPTPPAYQTIDDILTLRSIEETIELLSFQFGSPLLHAKVGTKEEPSSPEEVTSVNNRLVEMAPNGMITTDHRVDIDVINIQKAFANLMPFVEYFKNRVIIGAGSSPVSVGEGDTSNRATSESIDDALADRCTYLANIICNMFNFNIIPDILLSKGYQLNDLFDADGDLIVQMQFNEMRLEKQIMRENAVINMWNNHAITHDEMRRSLKRKPLTKAGAKELHIEKIDIPLAQAKQANKNNNGAANYTKTQTQPTNQYGTKAGPGSRKN